MIDNSLTRRDVLRHGGSYALSSRLLGDLYSPSEAETIRPVKDTSVEKYPVPQKSIRVSVEIDALVHSENVENIMDALNPYSAFIHQIFITNRKSIQHTLDSASVISKLLHSGFGEYSDVIVPHVTCRGLSVEDFMHHIDLLRKEGYKNAFVVRGDSDAGNYIDAWDNPRDFPDTVYEYLKETSPDEMRFICATHPELHPRSISIADEEKTMRDKISVGVKEFIGQSTLNAAGYISGIVTLNKIAPVRAYIYPITSNIVARDVARFSLSKISLQQERIIRKELSQEDQAIYWRNETFNLVNALLSQGIRNYHITAVKNITKTIEILDYLSLQQ